MDPHYIPRNGDSFSLFSIKAKKFYNLIDWDDCEVLETYIVSDDKFVIYEKPLITSCEDTIRLDISGLENIKLHLSGEKKEE
jgi:hypothetical protein